MSVPKHGHRSQRDGRQSYAYISWRNMKQRCLNSNATAFPWYGALGVTFCERWHSFANFYEDMGDRERWQSLDRIDPRGPYCKENCKWSTREEQANNKRIHWQDSPAWQEICAVF